MRKRKAITIRSYGGPEVLNLEHLDLPPLGDDEILIRTRAVSLNFGDRVTVSGAPKVMRLGFGLKKPKCPILGMDVAGVVEEVGAKVEGFAPGDEIFGDLSRGSCAEYAIATANQLAKKPDGFSFAQAATLPVAGATALRAMEVAEVKEGDRVLINGASGGVGNFAIQIARAFGAEVVAICRGTKAESARALGASEVIDYTASDYFSATAPVDVVIDLVGNHRLSQRLSILKPKGRYISSFGQGGGPSFGPLGRILGLAIRSIFDRRIKLLAVSADPVTLKKLAELAAEGKIDPFIEASFPFEEAKEAYTIVANGHAKGKVVIELNG